jgi:S1-C subfamily serine protease
MFVSHCIARRLVLGGLILAVASTARANPAIYQHVLRSTAWIVNKQENSQGSGVLVDLENGLVLTNDHVVGEATEVLVFFSAYDEKGELITDRSVYTKNFMALRKAGIAMVGTVVGRWTKKDLAVVQLEKLPENPVAISLAATSSEPGSNLHSVGNSGSSGGLWAYTPGVARNVYLKPTLQKGIAYQLETTSPSNPGDSGSPVVNDQGELVGIVSWSTVAGSLKKNGLGETVYDDHAKLITNAIDVREIRTLLEQYPGN